MPHSRNVSDDDDDDLPDLVECDDAPTRSVAPMHGAIVSDTADDLPDLLEYYDSSDDEETPRVVPVHGVIAGRRTRPRFGLPQSPVVVPRHYPEPFCKHYNLAIFGAVATVSSVTPQETNACFKSTAVLVEKLLDTFKHDKRRLLALLKEWKRIEDARAALKNRRVLVSARL